MMEKKFISLGSLFLICSALLLSFQAEAQNCFDIDTSGCGKSIYDKEPAAVDPDRTQRANPSFRESENQSMTDLKEQTHTVEQREQYGPYLHEMSGTKTNAGADASPASGKGGGDGKEQPASARTNGNGSPTNTNTNSDVIDQERQQAETAVASCESSAESVAGMCATDSSNSMTSGFMNMADGVARSFPTTGTGSSAAACQKTSDAVGAANAAMAAIKANCAMQYDSCKSSCETARTTLSGLTTSSVKSEFSSRLSKARTQCNSAQSRLNGIQQNIQQIAVASSNAQKCLQDTTGSTAVKTTDQLWAECRANPASPSCAMLPQTCDNPALATNATCVCYLQPNSAQCTGSTQVTTNGGGYGAGGVGASGNAALSSDEGWGGNSGDGTNPFAGDVKGSQLENANIPGGGGGGGGGRGGSANTPAPAPTGGGGGSKLNTNIIAGSRGGGGGGGFGARPGAARNTREVGSYAQNGSWIPPKMDDKNKIDLNRFRPGMNDFRRPTSQTRLAEIYGPEVDIWAAINRRYIIMSPGLKP